MKHTTKKYNKGDIILMYGNHQYNQNYNGIDFVKWIMAIFVVAIHTHPFENYTSGNILNIYNDLVKMAVPFFFISFGFLLFRKTDIIFYSDENKTRVKKYIYRILKLYLLWNIVFIPITLYGYFTNGKGLLYNLAYYIRGFVFVGEQFYSWPLWYLLSTLYSLILIYIFMKLKLSHITAFIISILFYVFGNIISLFIDNMDNLSGNLHMAANMMNIIFGSGRLFTGIAYIACGMLIAKYKMPFRWYYILFGVGIIILEKMGDISFLTFIPFIIICFVFFMCVMNLKLKDGVIWYWFRKSSTVMYFTHMIFFFLYTLLFKKFRYYGMDAFIITIVCTIVFSAIVIIFENKSKIFKTLFS